jgi:hypothetical protein
MPDEELADPIGVIGVISSRIRRCSRTHRYAAFRRPCPAPTAAAARSAELTSLPPYTETARVEPEQATARVGSRAAASARSICFTRRLSACDNAARKRQRNNEDHTWETLGTWALTELGRDRDELRFRSIGLRWRGCGRRVRRRRVRRRRRVGRRACGRRGRGVAGRSSANAARSPM